MHVTLIAGARPNFMKISPIINAIHHKKEHGADLHFRLVHTGQHYDEKMSAGFFKDLDIPEPDNNLDCGGGTQAEQTASIMVKFEKELLQFPTDLVLVVGDVTSTMACAIVAQKMGVKVAHVEAGIRSGDWSMPEEINRLVTDSITNYFFTTTEVASQNVRNSGVKEEQIFFVGNTMIDTLLKNEPRFEKPSLFDEYKLEPKNYIVVTLHRPANVDNEVQLNNLLEEIIHHSRNAKLIFPVHPRTRKNLEKLHFDTSNLILVEPMGYLEFNYLVKNALAVITDSGGITEETTVMGIPCMTLRDTTERPETCTIGTNELLGTNPKNIKPALEKLFNGHWKKGEIPSLWDGKAAERIVNHLMELFPH
jgi:UDP-N-acetylglucosamine 2-epimerase (non-hydrolysing)